MLIILILCIYTCAIPIRRGTVDKECVEQGVCTGRDSKEEISFSNYQINGIGLGTFRKFLKLEGQVRQYKTEIEDLRKEIKDNKDKKDHQSNKQANESEEEDDDDDDDDGDEDDDESEKAVSVSKLSHNVVTYKSNNEKPNQEVSKNVDHELRTLASRQGQTNKKAKPPIQQRNKIVSPRTTVYSETGDRNGLSQPIRNSINPKSLLQEGEDVSEIMSDFHRRLMQLHELNDLLQREEETGQMEYARAVNEQKANPVADRAVLMEKQEQRKYYQTDEEPKPAYIHKPIDFSDLSRAFYIPETRSFSINYAVRQQEYNSHSGGGKAGLVYENRQNVKARSGETMNRNEKQSTGHEEIGPPDFKSWTAAATECSHANNHRKKHDEEVERVWLAFLDGLDRIEAENWSE